MNEIKQWDKYFASKNGSIYSAKSGSLKKMKQQKHNDGYLMVTLSNKGIQKTFAVHRLIAECFIPNKNCKPEINHKNGIKTDNRVENLEWCTRKENVNHAYDMGLMENHTREGHPMAKLKQCNIAEIKDLIKNGLSQKEIANIYDVSRNTIGKINRGETWQ